MHESPIPACTPIQWIADEVTYIDQRFLPDQCVFARAPNVESIIAALTNGAVAGARCRDVFAGFGIVFARRESREKADINAAIEALRSAAGPRPYGFDAIGRVAGAVNGADLTEACAVIEDAQNIDRSIAKHGAGLLPRHGAILTLGSTGALSTGGMGTALAAIVVAHQSATALTAYVTETRPLCTGARLTAFELANAGVPYTVVLDAAAAALMHAGAVTAVIVGAALIAGNADALADIGTYGLALSAAHHRIPFYIATPRAAIDRSKRRGDDLAITAAGMVLNDITPGHLISAIVTEYGISRPPYQESLQSLADRPRFDLPGRRIA